MSEHSNSRDDFDKRSCPLPPKSPFDDESEASLTPPSNQQKRWSGSDTNSLPSSVSDGSTDNKVQENEAEYFPQLSTDSSDVTEEGNTLLGSISQSADDSADDFCTQPDDKLNFQNIFPSKNTDLINNLSESSKDNEQDKHTHDKKRKSLPENSVSSNSSSRTSNRTGESSSIHSVDLLTKNSLNRRCSKSPKLHARRKISPIKSNTEYTKKGKGSLDNDYDVSSPSRKRKWRVEDSDKHTGNTKDNQKNKADNTEIKDTSSSPRKNIFSNQKPNTHAVTKRNVQTLPAICENNIETLGNQPNESVEGDSNYSRTSSFSDTDSNLIIDETRQSDSNVADDTSGNGRAYMPKEKPKPHDKYKETDNTPEQLTISEREQFMTYLIQNLTCNLFYNTFCFSIPKGREAISAYKYFVKKIQELACELVTSGDFEPSTNMPLEISVEKASRIAEDMRERYAGVTESGTKEETSKDDIQQTPEQVNSDEVSETVSKGSAEQADNFTSGKSGSSSNSRNKLEQEVDNDLPQTAVFVVSDLTSSVKSSYAGQIVTCVNPVTNIMSISFFTYMPLYSDYVQDFICKKRISEEMLEEIGKNMEKFEISRQLRMDIPLNVVDSIHMYTETGVGSPGFILLRITQEPQFFQRWVHSRTQARNKWQARENFLPLTCLTSVPFTLFLGGNTDEISDIGAMIGRSVDHLMIKPQLSNPPFSTILSNMSSANKSDERHVTSTEMNDEDWSELAERRSETVSQCCCLVDVLLKHKLVNPVQANELKLHLIDFRKSRNTRSSRLIVSNIMLNDIPLQACLRDYIFRCDSAEELEKHLSTHLTAVALKENRLMDIPETELNLSAMKVVDFLNIEQYYYSFCLEKLASLDDYQHCSCCHTCTLPCVTHFLQNLFYSNKPFCSNCGMVGEDTFLIMPESLAPSQLAFRKDIAEEWSIQDVQSDTIHFPDPCDDLQNLDKPETVFRLDDVMCDPFGLSDPVAFLLGSEARGIDSQQGRCRQKYRKKEKPDRNALPCSIQ